MELKRAVLVRTIFWIAIFMMALRGANAQDVFGVISGTVTDPTGAVVAGVQITIRNEETRATRLVTSNDAGFYTAPQLQVGHYTVLGEKTGFKSFRVTSTDLNAGAHVTIDLKLSVGAANETIEVASQGETVNTLSGEISRTIDQQQVQSLALNQRNYVQLTTIVPGAATVTTDPTTLTFGMGTNAAAINGLRTDQTSFTVDGGFNLDSGSNSSQLNNVGIDFIREVGVQTSNFSAEYGRNAGASVNVVTRSGGNAFHGGLFEFLRNDYFDAIFPGSKISATSSTPVRNLLTSLRYNDFGYDLGGPIIKDKLFFFVGEEWKRQISAPTPSSLTVPTTAELGGDFRDILVAGNAATVLKTPANATAGCTITNNVLSPTCISADGKAIANVYAQAAARAAVFNNTASSSNVTFQPVNPSYFREDIARVDWHPGQKHLVYYRYIHDDINLVDPFGTFNAYPSSTTAGLPTTPTNRLRPGYTNQVADVWTISSNLINEAKFNVSWNKQRIPPSGNTWQRATYGFQFPLPFPNAGTYPTGIPYVSFNNTAGIANSNVAPFSGPYFSLAAPTTDIVPSDTLTWLRGAHTLKFGGLFARNRKDQNSRPNYNGSITFQSSGNPNSTGDAVADALIGNFQTFTQASADPVGHFRFNNISLFVVDNWKVTSRLGLELGLRFERTTPTYTQGNNMVNFDPSQYTTANAPTSISSGNVPTGGNLDNGYVITGLVRPGAVPGEQVARVPGATGAFVSAVPATAPRGFFPTENLVGPRVGLSFALMPTTVIRAGYGLFFDKPEGNIIFGQPGVVPFLQSVTYTNGNIASPSGGAAVVPTIYGLSAVQPNLRVARNSQYSLSAQNQGRGGFLYEAAYVGNVGRHLLRQPNINSPTFASTAANPGKAANQVRPYFGYTDITQFRSDSMSDYNALQLSATRRRGNLVLNLNYTWSKNLATTSGESDNPEPECPFTCTLADGTTTTWNKFYYGPTSFDRRHIFSASYTYTLPWFKSGHGFKGEALGGWSVSGITREQTGQRLTANSTTIIGGAASGSVSYNRRANVVQGIPLYSGYTCAPLKRCAFNPAAFAAPSAFAVGNAPIGSIGGPSFQSTDLSVRKLFSLWHESNLLFQADAFNFLNRASYSNPNTSVGGSLGLITSSSPGRQMQFGAKITF